MTEFVWWGLIWRVRAVTKWNLVFLRDTTNLTKPTKLVLLKNNEFGANYIKLELINCRLKSSTLNTFSRVTISLEHSLLSPILPIGAFGTKSWLSKLVSYFAKVEYWKNFSKKNVLSNLRLGLFRWQLLILNTQIRGRYSQFCGN